MISTPVRTERADAGTRTLPAMHGVVLRPPVRVNPPTAPIKNIEQLMTEADPVRTLSQTGSIRMLKRLSPEHDAPAGAPATTPKPVLPRPDSRTVTTLLSPPSKARVFVGPATPPPFPPTPQPMPVPIAPVPQKVEPPTAIPPISIDTLRPKESESPFILKPIVSAARTSRIIPPSSPVNPPLMPFGAGVIRRKARMTELARIVLPQKKEESGPIPVPPPSAPTIVPASFSVASPAPSGGAPGVQAEVSPLSESPALAPETEKPIATEMLPPPATIVEEKSPAPVAELLEALNAAPEVTTPRGLETVQPDPAPVSAREEQPPPLVPDLPDVPIVQSEPPAPPTAENLSSELPPPFIPAKPLDPVPELCSLEPKVDPEAHKPEPSPEPVPRIDPEAHKPDPSPEPPPKVEPEALKPEPPPAPEPRIEVQPTPATPTPATVPPVTELGVPPETSAPEKREFHLANGERVAGVVLSETPEAVYIDHETLGVLTVPRAQIAKRLVEIILINGDRIVGDIMAETADTLYVRHASLGMLTVPRAQRSTRVVEAILTNGDRILGEVLTETDRFTVIRSATMGTVTVPHSKVSMLNRKIEQIELKSLPPPPPELQDKPSV